MLYIKLFIEREKNIGQSAPECPFKWVDIEERSWKSALDHSRQLQAWSGSFSNPFARRALS